MDSHTWKVIYQCIRRADRSIPRFGRRARYSDGQIVAMYVWSVMHDRPLCWACNRENYTSRYRPRRLPSVSQFCKRIKTDRCDAILQFIHEALSEIESFTELSFIDGRASGIILADGAYDSGTLYDQVDDDGGQLITPLPANAGKGHRRQSAARLRAIDLWHPLGGYVYRKRVGIERTFAHQPAFGGGLAPLPPWVRTLPRVRRWIGTKLIIYHARMHVRKAVI